MTIFYKYQQDEQQGKKSYFTLTMLCKSRLKITKENLNNQEIRILHRI